METLHFYKMHGLGNDFVIFDQRSEKRAFSKEDILNICDRNKGIGCDQLIIINRNSDPAAPFIHGLHNTTIF